MKRLFLGLLLMFTLAACQPEQFLPHKPRDDRRTILPQCPIHTHLEYQPADDHFICVSDNR